MKTILSVLCFLYLSLVSVNAAHYAVLVAGSNEFYNYRHQADIYHSYQLLKKNGVPTENIITFAYNDIANDPENPFPGKVFNKPTTGPGEDVYAGIQIDYQGADVTPENFLACITGDSTKTGGKKVLKSTNQDNVFIYFSDHGASGLIAFPSEYLYANDLISALNTMHKQDMYKQLVFYLEACEAGSMFQGLLSANINIYATTAANAEESSYGTYCPPDDVVNGTEVGSCLGDLYSVSFLENLEAANPSNETLLAQFKVVVQETNLSHVQKYGDMSIDTELIGEFEGNNAAYYSPLNTERAPRLANVDSRMNKLHYLQTKYVRKPTEENQRKLEEELESIVKLDNTFYGMSQAFNLNLNAPVENINFDCLKQRVAMYEEACGKLSDYGLKYVRYIYYTCSQNVDTYGYELQLIKQCF